jgi:hypothetical protein
MEIVGITFFSMIKTQVLNGEYSKELKEKFDKVESYSEFLKLNISIDQIINDTFNF